MNAHPNIKRMVGHAVGGRRALDFAQNYGVEHA